MVDQDTLKAGDVVQLMSGGPRMTVREPKFYDDKRAILVQWISADGLCQHQLFIPEMLKIVEEDSQ